MPRRKQRSNGEGTIYKRSDGLWVAQLCSTKLGKRLTFYGKTKSEALQKLQKAIADRATGSLVAPTKITLEQWLRLWLDTYKRRTVHPNTYSTYESVIRNHIIPTIGNIPLQHIQPYHVQTVYNRLLDAKATASTIRLIHTVLHAALDRAVRENYISHNPADTDAVNLPAPHTSPRRALTPEELQNLYMAASTHRLYPAIVLAATTGLRRGELFGLTWDDVDFAHCLIAVRRSVILLRQPNQTPKIRVVIQDALKNEYSRRVIPVLEEVMEMLGRHKEAQEAEKMHRANYEDNNLVFCTRTGKPMSPDWFTAVVKRIAKQAGMPWVTPHVLRHTYTTNLTRKQVNARIVQDLLGHSQVTTTMKIYTHVDDAMRREAVSKIHDMLPPV